MKKWLAVILSCVLIFGLTTCSALASSGEGESQETAAGSIVYMTTDISPEGLMAVYEALGWTPEGKVAVKLSTGEPPASNYLRPELIADVVSAVDGTIVECNTAYGGSRAETAMHYQVAEDHGFTAIAPFQILDENGSCRCRSRAARGLRRILWAQPSRTMIPI